MTQPLLTLTYEITAEHALAYETLPREITGWRKWALLVWLGAVGGLVAFLPPDWVGPDWEWRFWVWALGLVSIGYGVATAVMTLGRYRRARRRVRAPVQVTLEQWGDHIAVDAAGRKSFAAYETIAAVTVGEAHVFIDTPPDVIIVPLSAFADRAEMVAFGEDIDRLSGDSAP